MNKAGRVAAVGFDLHLHGVVPEGDADGDDTKLGGMELHGEHLERLRRAAYDPFDPRVIAAAPFDVWRLLGTAVTGRF